MSVKLSELKVIALDFDGTLVESNHIKDRAFETIFSDWPEHQDAMMRWHFDHNSTERQEKFRYFVEDVLALTSREDLIQELTTKFGNITRQAVIDCPFVDGAQNFLENIQSKVETYLVSATPRLELESIIENRDLEKYFKKVYGAPINKTKMLKNIMKNEHVLPLEMLFIGDSQEDQYAAKSLGIDFIGRKSDRPLNGEFPIFMDFFQIQKYLNI